jgi:hypothetical protein
MTIKNITLSAEKTLIDRARQRAKADNTTLNSEFRRWLAQYVESPQTTIDLIDLIDRFSYVKPGKTITRDDLNER